MKMQWLCALILLIGIGLLAGTTSAWAQEEGGKEVAAGLELDAEAAAAADAGTTNFFGVIKAGGFFGILLWVSIFACSIGGVWLSIDSFVTIQQKKIAPESLAKQVEEAMEQGDVMKAMAYCEEEPGPLASILQAGFSNVEEGFEAVQEAVGVSAELTSEKLMQRVNYLNVIGNLAPMLGLLGTVQGMILAFATLGTASGAAKQSMLAVNISQALYTTAAGLCVAIPAVAFYFFFRNRTMNIILGMEAMTMDLIKVLRNVEVVEE